MKRLTEKVTGCFGNHHYKLFEEIEYLHADVFNHIFCKIRRDYREIARGSTDDKTVYTKKYFENLMEKIQTNSKRLMEINVESQNNSTSNSSSSSNQK